jgi:tripartite-type tricarboxylate transporter receptor subunit TctC
MYILFQPTQLFFIYICFLLTCFSGVIYPLSAQAQSDAYPNRPVTLVVPFAAGGGTDGTARVFAATFGQQLGQTVIVQNKPSAGGIQSTAAVATSNADGYTLLWANTTTLGVAPQLLPNIPYDPLKSFQLISRAATGPLTLVVNNSVPAKNLAELITYAKSHPGKLNFASAGVGTVIHLTGEYLKSRAGIDIVHVPYKGNGPALIDVMSGQIQMMFIGLGHVAQYVKDGKLKAIAIASAKRHPMSPMIPNFGESGLADFEITEWFGLAAPAGIPSNVLEKLNDAFRKTAASESIRTAFTSYGYDAISETPEQFHAAVEREGLRWKNVIKPLGIKINQL